MIKTVRYDKHKLKKNNTKQTYSHHNTVPHLSLQIQHSLSSISNQFHTAKVT